MAEVVGFHGIAQEQLGRWQLLPAWEPSLKDGIDHADPQRKTYPSFDLAFYGDLFLSEEDQGSAAKGAAGGAILEFTENTVLTADDIAFLSEAVDELAEQLTPPRQKAAEAIPKFLQPIVGSAARRLDLNALLRLIPQLVQVKLYLENDVLAESVRNRVSKTLAGGCRALVGHSLGSVVAFDLLTLRPDLPVDTLVTIGSPLSIKTVAKRLRGDRSHGKHPGAPRQLRCWANIYDPKDPVACAGSLKKLWPGTANSTVHNGNHPHDCAKYLGKRVTGQAVLEALG